MLDESGSELIVRDIMLIMYESAPYKQKIMIEGELRRSERSWYNK